MRVAVYVLPPRWLVRAALIAACVLVLGATAVVVAQALTTVVVVTASLIAAILLTALLEPFSRRLRSVGLPDWLAALTVLVVTLALLAGVVTLLLTRAQAQSNDLQGAVVDGLDKLRQFADNLPLPIPDDRLDKGASDLAGAALDALPSPAAGAGLATQVLSGIALALFAWFFLLKDGRTMWDWAVGWAPRSRAAAVDRAGQATWDVLTAYVRGTTVIALADATGIGIAMLVIGVPLVASLSVLVFLGAYVPIVGAFLSGSLACIVALVALGPAEALVLLACVLVVQQLEGNFLQPLVMGRALRLHPLAIVTAVAVGTTVAGVLGALISVPLVAIAYRLALQARSPAGGEA